MADRRERLKTFALSLHPGKTRLIEFGRFAARDRKRRGLGKPESFMFLGFTHLCGQSRSGKFRLKRKSRRDRHASKLREIKDELKRRTHQPITGPSRSKELGSSPSCAAILPITRFRPTFVRSPASCGKYDGSGSARCAAVARRTAPHGGALIGAGHDGSPSRRSFTPGLRIDSPSDIQDGSPVRSFRTPGFVPGAQGNPRPYGEGQGVTSVPTAI